MISGYRRDNVKDMCVKNRNCNGNSFTQYGIVILLLLLSIVPVFFMVGKTIDFSFKEFLNVFSDDANSSTTSVLTLQGSDKINGENAKTPTDDLYKPLIEKPQTICTGNTCTIDYNGVKLYEVPSDIAELLETSGTGAATSIYAELLSQIAEQVSNIDSISEQDKEKINTLAQLAYEIAHQETSIETYVAQGEDILKTVQKNFDEDYYKSLDKKEQGEYLEKVLQPLNDFMGNSKTDTTPFYSNLLNITSSEMIDQAKLNNLLSKSADESVRQQFDFLLSDVTESISTVDPKLKEIISLLGSDVQLLANNMTDSYLSYNDLETVLSSQSINTSKLTNTASTKVDSVLSYSDVKIQSIIDNPKQQQSVIENILKDINVDLDNESGSEYIDIYKNNVKTSALNDAISLTLKTDKKLTDKQKALLTTLQSKLSVSLSSTLLTSSSDISLASSFINFISNANDGLTSEQTDLDSKLIDVSYDGKEEVQKSSVEE